MTTLQVHSLVQASAPLRLKARTKPALLPTGSIGSSPAAPSLFAENGVIWATDSSNNMYPVAFNSVTAFQNWGTKISSGWKNPFASLDAAAYAMVAFSYQDYPGLRSGQDFWMYACTPTLVPMCMSALKSLNADPGSKAGPACRSLGTTCSVLTANGTQNMSIAYVLLVPDTSKLWSSLWSNGCSW